MLVSMIPDHDVPPGPLTRCQISGSSNLEPVIDLDCQPLCDSLLSKDDLSRPEPYYPLRLYICPESGLAQLDYVVEGSLVYHPDYPYRSGITKELEVYQRAFAQEVMTELGTAKQALCIDIGSNDGTLLTGFKRLGMRTLGIEPTNIAKIARQESGIDTIQSFFVEALAKEIATDFGKAKVITATNVFAHMASLGEVMRGICRLLDDDGVFITESHYLLDVVEKTQFDTVYHEHIRTYSLKSLVTLFGYYGLEVFHVRRADRYGGNIRAYVARKGSRPVSAGVGELLDLEVERGLFDPKTYHGFRARVHEARDRLMTLAYRARRSGAAFVGNSCPGRCSTLLNYYGMTRDLMPYIAEQPASLKLGLYLPGKHIPVVVNQRLIDEQPEYVVLLAWHYAQPIAEQLRARGLKSKLVTPLPQVETLEI
ncbi:MAG: class I SAM-dependent methyltransferase [Proteobacteria bacterium]|nr:MAG: class I SAM-dependent methyltransferase [Pseudomonadota bacterium]